MKNIIAILALVPILAFGQVPEAGFGFCRFDGAPFGWVPDISLGQCERSLDYTNNIWYRWNRDLNQWEIEEGGNNYATHFNSYVSPDSIYLNPGFWLNYRGCDYVVEKSVDAIYKDAPFYALPIKTTSLAENLLHDSENFEDGAASVNWQMTAGVDGSHILDAVSSPSGDMSMDYIVNSSGTGRVQQQIEVGIDAATDYYFGSWFYTNPGSDAFIILSLHDLSNGTASTFDTIYPSTTINRDVASFKSINNVATSDSRLRMDFINTDGLDDTIYAWGLQLQTSPIGLYIPTGKGQFDYVVKSDTAYAVKQLKNGILKLCDFDLSQPFAINEAITFCHENDLCHLVDLPEGEYSIDYNIEHNNRVELRLNNTTLDLYPNDPDTAAIYWRNVDAAYGNDMFITGKGSIELRSPAKAIIQTNRSLNARIIGIKLNANGFSGYGIIVGDENQQGSIRSHIERCEIRECVDAAVYYVSSGNIHNLQNTFLRLNGTGVKGDPKLFWVDGCDIEFNLGAAMNLDSAKMVWVRNTYIEDGDFFIKDTDFFKFENNRTSGGDFVFDNVGYAEIVTNRLFGGSLIYGGGFVDIVGNWWQSHSDYRNMVVDYCGNGQNEVHSNYGDSGLFLEHCKEDVTVLSGTITVNELTLEGVRQNLARLSDSIGVEGITAPYYNFENNILASPFDGDIVADRLTMIGDYTLPNSMSLNTHTLVTPIQPGEIFTITHYLRGTAPFRINYDLASGYSEQTLLTGDNEWHRIVITDTATQVINFIRPELFQPSTGEIIDFGGLSIVRGEDVPEYVRTGLVGIDETGANIGGEITMDGLSFNSIYPASGVGAPTGFFLGTDSNLYWKTPSGNVRLIALD